MPSVEEVEKLHCSVKTYERKFERGLEGIVEDEPQHGGRSGNGGERSFTEALQQGPKQMDFITQLRVRLRESMMT